MTSLKWLRQFATKKLERAINYQRCRLMARPGRDDPDGPPKDPQILPVDGTSLKRSLTLDLRANHLRLCQRIRLAPLMRTPYRGPRGMDAPLNGRYLESLVVA